MEFGACVNELLYACTTGYYRPSPTFAQPLGVSPNYPIRNPVGAAAESAAAAARPGSHTACTVYVCGRAGHALRKEERRDPVRRADCGPLTRWRAATLRGCPAMGAVARKR